jgi:hypothetical protein
LLRRSLSRGKQALGARRRGRLLGGARGAGRATTITIAGSPADFTVRIGFGRWLEHLEVAAIETRLISDLSLVVDVAESAWKIEIEDKLVKDLNPRLLPRTRRA